MKSCIPWAACCVWLFAGTLFAQVEAGPPSVNLGPPAPGDRSALVNNGQDNGQNNNQELAALRDRIAELEQKLTQNTPMPTPDTGQIEEIRELAARLGMLEQNVNSLKSSVNALVGTVGQRQAFSGELPILSKMRTDAGFRDEMRNVIQGRLLFNNLTGTEQTLLINGNRWRVPPGQSHLMVPFGTAMLMSRFACTGPKALEMPFSSMA